MFVRRFVATSSLFVSLFFILSGFVLAYAYADPSRRVAIEKRTFWINRLARLYPVYLFALALSFLTYLKLNQPTIMTSYPLSDVGIAVVTTITATQAWLPMRIYDFTAGFPNIPAWAVSVEIFFYLVFPFLVPIVLRLRRPQLLLSLVGLYVAYIGIWTVLSAGHLILTLPGQPLFDLPEFLIGVVLGRVFLEAIDSKPSRPIQGVDLVQLGSVLSSVGVILVLSGNVPGYAPLDIDPLTVQHFLVIPLFAILTYCLAYGRGPMAWIASLPVVVVLGQASYAIYILQEPVLAWLQRLGAHLPRVSPSSSIFTAASMLVLVGLSVVVLRVLEEPARITFQRMLIDPKKRTSASLGSSTPRATTQRDPVRQD